MNILLFFLILFPTWSEAASLDFLSRRAENLWQAHDYAGASQLYNEILEQPLSPWQQARVAYNLGTLRIAQHQPQEALTFFQRLTPTALSLPRFGRDLLINMGIAYGRYAQTLMNTSLDSSILCTERSLEALHKANELECQLWQLEQDQPPTACHLPLIDAWTKAMHLQLHAMEQKRRQNWIEQASSASLASFLQSYLTQFRLRIQHLQMPHNQDATPLFTYMQHQLEAFDPLWKALQQRKISEQEKLALEQAQQAYLKAIEDFSQKESSSAVQQLEQASEALKALAFQAQAPLQQLRLQNEILLLQAHFQTDAIQALLLQLDAMKEKANSHLSALEEIWQISLAAAQSRDFQLARFYLIASLSLLDSLLDKGEKPAVAILTQALQYNLRHLALLLLARLMENASPSEHIQVLLRQQQQFTLKQASFFIPAVLKEQSAFFQQAHNSSICQQFPWEQIIPLFSQGLQAAQFAEAQLLQTPLKFLELLAADQRTHHAWQQALTLLQHPSQASTFSPKASVNSSKSLADTLSLIQEMYLQDQSQPVPEERELHAW